MSRIADKDSEREKKRPTRSCFPFLITRVFLSLCLLLLLLIVSRSLTRCLQCPHARRVVLPSDKRHKLHASVGATLHNSS